MFTSIHIRYIQAILFVAVYIAIGYFLQLGTEAYLLLGIPLTILFQYLFAKQPIHKLWLRDEEKFYLSTVGWIIAACFLVFPVYRIVELVMQDQLTGVVLGYYTASALGAFCAGYCFSRFTKKTTKEFFLCLGIAILLRSAMYLLPFLFTGKAIHPDYVRGVSSLLTYIPIAFVVEEVVFRGMLDTYVQPSHSSAGIGSAVFISTLWGLWHLPLYAGNGNPLWFTMVTSMIISLWGILLSVCWRRIGNLAVPSFAHAFVDAIRDAFR